VANPVLTRGEQSMRALTAEDIKTVRGATMRRDPAREPCFTVVQLHKDLHDYEGMSDVSRRQRLHRHMHNEMQTLEIVAQSLADFPDAPWELRLEMARQCWDETRHSAILYRRLQELGGRKGDFPIMNYEWGVTQMLDSLPARLAVQNRTFEGGEMDLLRQQHDMWSGADDAYTAALMDALLADEVQHVRYANRWLKRMARENPRILLQVAVGVQLLRKVTAALAPAPGEVNAVGVNLTAFVHNDVMANIDDRRLAEFTEEEIAELLRQEGLGSVVSAAHGAA
jgi:uncharacterized ferritin-like protein (DUF455 family)